jgi:hypothetical protein
MKEELKKEMDRLIKFMHWLEENYPNVIDDYWSETGGK